MDKTEIVARALFANDGRYEGQKFDYCSDRVKGFFRSDAQAALKALDDAGYAVVPKVPTSKILMAGEDSDTSFGAYTVHAIYTAMIAAGEEL